MFLKQSTAYTFRFGPFVDDTDFKTAEPSLTIAQADMLLSKGGAAFAQKGTAGNATHDTDGWYSTTLSTTDTNTVGTLDFMVVVAGALPVWRHFYVLEEAIYDALFASGAAGFDVTANVKISPGSVSSFWDVLTSTLTTSGSIGKYIVDNLDAQVSSRSTLTAAGVWSHGTRELTSGANIVLAKGVGLTGLNDVSTSQVNAEVVDVLATDLYGDLGAPPAASSTLADKLRWLFMLAKNEIDETASAQRVKNDGGTTIGTATVSDDGATTTRGKWA